MYCPKCGNLLADDAKFCSACGTTLGQEPAQSAPQGTQPPYTPVQNQVPLQNPQAARPMGWFKFLIYFALFAGALLNLISSIVFLTGAAYGDDRGAIYLFLPSLHTVDIIVGLIMLVLAGLQIYTRFQLAGYKKNGPSLVLAVYLVSILANLFYAIAFTSIISPLGVEMEAGFGEQITSIVVSVVMMIVNYIYFKKRKDLFVR